MSGARTPRERAARLLRWYPRAWRERYGEEFAELLIDEMEERPRSAGRTLAYEVRLATAACAVMSVFLVGCGSWVRVGRPPGLAPAGVADGHPGLIDLAATVLLALALAAAYRAQGTATRSRRLARR